MTETTHDLANTLGADEGDMTDESRLGQGLRVFWVAANKLDARLVTTLANEDAENILGQAAHHDRKPSSIL